MNNSLKELAKAVDDKNGTKDLKPIADLGVTEQGKVLVVGKDADFDALDEKLQDENFLVEDKILASIDGANYTEFKKDAFEEWLRVARMISEQKRSQLFWDAHGMRVGNGSTSKNHVAKNVRSKRKSRSKSSKASRRKNR